MAINESLSSLTINLPVNRPWNFVEKGRERTSGGKLQDAGMPISTTERVEKNRK
jgi:hypothetical protein